MKKYKRNLDIGDEAISKRTALRYKAAINEVQNVDKIERGEILVDDVVEVDCCINEEVLCTENNADNMNCTTIESQNLDLNDHLRSMLLEEEKECLYQSHIPHSFNEMIEDVDFFQPIRAPVNVKKGELFLMILKYSITNKLSFSAMTNLFKLFNVIFESPVMPDSRYSVDNILNPKDSADFHAVCPNCTAYIGKLGEIESVKECQICQAELNLDNPSNTSFFVIIDPSTQIKDLIHCHQDYYDYVMKKRVRKTDCIEDVYDGKEYRKFVDSLPTEEKYSYVSAIFNTDGAPKFESSQYSIWPLYLMLNELPKQQRMNKLITCGLWFNKKKPDMAVFLSTFVDIINKLTNEGISCTVKNENKILKLYVLACCVDSVARAPVQGIKQFNGNFGCSWCLHPGKWAEGSMRYPLLTNKVNCRNHKATVQNMLTVTPEYPIDGIKYPSPLINLSNFNIVSGFVVDYLHCCLEGVASLLTEYHLNSMSKDDIKEIDMKISKITAPHQISRLSRPISSRNDWKAREWENYVLFYSVPVLEDHLSRKYLLHWLLFVESLYILLQSDINIRDLNKADEMLHEFVGKCEEYFGIKCMTYNIHQLLHISQSVLSWGPLWCQSTFCFESANQTLLKAIHCSKGVTLQIVRFININHLISVLQELVYPQANILVKMYCDEYLTSKVQNCCKIRDITYFGLGDQVPNNLLRKLQLSETSTRLYDKMVNNGCLYESCTKNKIRSNNSFAQLKDKTFINIIYFIVDDETKQEFTVCNVIKTRSRFTNYYNNLKVIENIGTEPTIVITDTIESICIYMKILNKMYICSLPNLLHY